MAAFKFKFKVVQNVKENLKKKAQKELSQIEKTINNLVSDKTALQGKLKNQKLSTDHNIKISEARFIKDYAVCLDAGIKTIDKKIKILTIEREKKIETLLQKSKEHKMFNKIEEQHLERFTEEQNKLESKNVDEIAILKFARTNK
jgi:flagellar export protein FliJ